MGLRFVDSLKRKAVLCQILLALIGVTLASVPGGAQQEPKFEKAPALPPQSAAETPATKMNAPIVLPEDTEAPAFKLGIATTQYLPQEMYGQWSMTATLEETTAPRMFSPIIHDIWVLARDGDAVTVTNPKTGASATVHVDEVHNNTATFHRRFVPPKGRRVFQEQPTVTVDTDHLYGRTLLKFSRIRRNGTKKTYFARYHLEGERIGGERVTFGAERGGPELIIEDVRQEQDNLNKKDAEKPLLYSY
ncbi:MAG: hypothetical protein KTR14_07870 [Vampirovibrio sp.]|nr:hypothetical protein [Vampirovibrio sp.]